MNFKELLSLRNIKQLLVYAAIAASSVFLTKACMVEPIPIVVPSPTTVEPVKEVVDLNNKIHSVITQQVIEKKEQKKYVDSITKVLKVTEKDLESVTKTVDVTEGKFSSPTNIQYLNKDTIYSVHKKDNWIDISAYAGKDSGTILLSMRDSLTYSMITKSRLFSTSRYVDIQHSNPYIRTQEGYSLTFKEKQPYIIIGPSISYGFDGKNLKPVVGISATIPLIKIK